MHYDYVGKSLVCEFGKCGAYHLSWKKFADLLSIAEDGCDIHWVHFGAAKQNSGPLAYNFC